MAFTLAVAGQPALAATYNELAAYFNGSASAGSNPLQLITLNDSTNYVLLIKQLDTTNGRVFQVLKADGTRLMTITKTGVTLSVDGTTQDQVPAVLSAIQTFSAAVTFSAALTAGSTLGVTGVATFATSVIETRAANTASAAGAQTLPAGVQIPITGTNTITSIVAGAAGRRVTLEFASAGCTVKVASTLRLNGDYIATAGGTLSLESDGTNWNETGRSGGSVPGAAYRISAATQSIVSGAERIVSWTATDYQYGLTAATTSAPVPGILGRWLVSANLVRDVAALSAVQAWVLKNGAHLYPIAADDVAGGGPNHPVYPSAKVIEVTSITDTYGVGVTSGNTADLIGGAAGSSFTLTYLGR